jgi:hypothetical protein
MRELCRLCCLASGLLLTLGSAPARAGTVTGLSLSAATAPAGTAVSATATGSNPCGAVHIDWGDGTAITYPITMLPVTQTHAYQAAGTFNVRAQGMGNCDGQATARITITAPPAPPPAPPAPLRITGIEVGSPPDAPASVRAIRVVGTGQCAYTLDFGDGNNEGRNAKLPDEVRHNYPAEGRYTIVATASAPCAGVMRSTIVIGRERQGDVSAVEVRPRVARAGQQVTIVIAGSGTCRFVVDLDDGESRTMTEPLPHRFTYRYSQTGNYEIVVSAEQPCTGQAQTLLRVRRR